MLSAIDVERKVTSNQTAGARTRVAASVDIKRLLG
jgi:hypothetical protein